MIVKSKNDCNILFGVVKKDLKLYEILIMLRGAQGTDV